MLKLPIGISDYKHLIEGSYYYVDKTLFIKEVVETGGAVALICRPRRFGKTLNLSMLHYFFEKSVDSNSHLFEDKAIWQDEECRSLQGQYAVIFLTFKDIKEDSWEKAFAEFTSIIAQEFKRHRPLIEANVALIDRDDFVIFNSLAARTASDMDVSRSLFFLSKILSDITKKRVILLLDEYDTPIHAAYSNCYYDKMIHFMRGLLSKALKDNKHVEHAVLTGILRTAKEGLFSGLNNLNVCTLLHNAFADKFGFVEHEVDSLLIDQNICFKLETIKDWYNGYRIGERVFVYNPWSILECAKNNGELNVYWVNTSDNILIKKLIVESDESVKIELESLLTNASLDQEIDITFSFSDIQYQTECSKKALWSLLLFSGYLTYSSRTLVGEVNAICSLIIPNKEIQALYRHLLKMIVEASLKTITLTAMINALQIGEVERFSKALQEFVANSMSYYDFSHNEPEKSYHLFILGMLVFLKDTYHVRSNRESGDGRYDVMLIPKDITRPGIVLEFKKADSDKKQELERVANQALEQVREKNYIQELRAQSVAQILVYVMAFYGKKLVMKMGKLSTE